MLLLQRLGRQLRLGNIWIAIGVLGPIGMLAILVLMMLDIRRDDWSAAEQTSDNLLQVIEQDLARNFELYDLSLQAVVDNLKVPDLQKVSPALRQLVLFDRAASASDKGAILVLDENGDVTEDMSVVPPRKGNYADRQYFKVHRDRPDVGLFISKPLISRISHIPMIALSRRINKPDGSFGGVVVGTLKLSYFVRLFDRIALGREGAINLFRSDGTRIARYPYVDSDIGSSIAGSSTFERFLREGRGSFTATSTRDQVERHYAFSGVGTLPLILDVALSTREVESNWRVRVLPIGSISLLLCGSTVVLVLWTAREFRRRVAVQAELARLSKTDALTGIANRRSFDEALPAAWSGARREAMPLSLLIVDADHFKRINDRFGHGVGDGVLQALALCLAAVARRQGDLVCRLGGEEFALLLADTSRQGAQEVAEAVHKRIAAYRSWPTGIEPGAVTVSIGGACLQEIAAAEAYDLYRAADAALYDAKAAGRNQTRWTMGTQSGSHMSDTSLRLVAT